MPPVFSDGSADIRAEITDQVHDCVPLGWNPQHVDDGYVVGESIEFEPNGVWLPPAWLGYVPARRLDGEEQKIIGVMHMLEARGFVKETKGRRGTWYGLTPQAMPFYYSGNFYGNNPLHQSFLCYSKIAVTHVEMERKQHRARVSWGVRPFGGWADAQLRAVAVVLGPQVSPVNVTYRDVDGDVLVHSVSGADDSRLALER